MMPLVFWMITSIENGPVEVAQKEEDQTWKGFSVYMHVLLPVAGLALLWGQRGFFARVLLQLDRSCVSVYCPSISRREKLLKWASHRLPTTWSSQARTLSNGIPELWKDGSLLCTLINSVVPGACPNPHRHWRKPPLHAQALAYKYLGLVPMFTESDFSTDFTINQERNFIAYLHKLQEVINKWSTKDEWDHKFSSQYVARGMGLCTGEQHRKTIFYIYSNSTGKKRGNVLMYIRGPYGTKGTATISPFHNLKNIPVVNVLHNQLEATKLLQFKTEEQKSFLKTISLDFTSLISSEEKEGHNDIPIQIDMELDRAKVTYIPPDNGIYEISLICEGELLRGSPYVVQVMVNTSGKKDNFNTDYENIEEKITCTKRKILCKVIDCVDQKICINTNEDTKIKKDSPNSSTDSENNDLTITAVTKKNDEILKTEINCSLEDILEEINEFNGNKKLKQIDSVDGIKEISQHLKVEMSNSVEVVDPEGATLLVDSQHKIVKDCDDIKTEIINLFQPSDDEIHFNVEKEQNVTEEPQLVSTLDIGFGKPNEVLEKLLPKTLIKGEDVNNNFSKNAPLKRIKSKICLEVSPKTPVKVTSPICPDHIAPEVEVESTLNELTLSEKRKTLAKQPSVNSSDEDVPFSPAENEDPSKCKETTFRKLSVLNVLDSLKQSRKGSLSESSEASHNSIVSLPNVTSTDSNYGSIEDTTFKTRKNYWERMSSRSSSSVSLANSDYVQKRYYSPKKLEAKVTIKYSKSDDSLDGCSLIPLEERKKKLLKEMYQKETRVPKKLNIGNFFKKSQNCKVEEEDTHFSSISDRIRTFDKTAKIEAKTESPKDPKKSTSTFKSHFKKAINFFKTMENTSKLNDKTENIKRRYSLDHQKKHKQKFRSGSLNLPLISDRFSVDNLYEDVFGNRKGSFKGTPNKSVVAESVASLSGSLSSQKSQEEGKDTISYNLFVNKSKSKKRKSIKSLFDVHY